MRQLLVLLMFSYTFLSAQNNSSYFEKADEFFKTYIENGKVKYAEIKQNPKLLSDLLTETKKMKVSPENPKVFKAFWINAYNLAVIDGIIKNYPVKSPLDIKGFFDVQKHSLGQQSVTLDEIEHKILFGNFPEESRFHFVLVCAARSCPPLISEAYKPDTVEDQMHRQTEIALNNPEFIQLKKDKVLFSEIMKWFKDDFTKGVKSLIDYVNQHRKTPIPETMEIGFYEYNWELNDF
ncbi:DUF547 domain-containing protein [Gillisia sp. Q332]|uniref:DUF547 domain-containing protein n=1 Tax=Gillisia xinjiangensis TaxID=3384765 RepID=UPI003918941B